VCSLVLATFTNVFSAQEETSSATEKLNTTHGQVDKNKTEMSLAVRVAYTLVETCKQQSIFKETTHSR